MDEDSKLLPVLASDQRRGPRSVRQQAAARRAARAWNAKRRQPDPWLAAPASPVRVLDKNSAEFAELVERYKDGAS